MNISDNTPKTDKEKLTALLTEFGVGFKLTGDEVTCEKGDAKIAGYTGFSTTFSFDPGGRFKEMGAWE